MLSRPVDDSGDILPVTQSSDLLSGVPAVKTGLTDHRCLFFGEWWEDPEKGNEILDLISESRCTDQDAETLESYLVSYLLEFPGVRSISDVSSSFSGHTFYFSCTAHTDSGDLTISDSI
ncbi:MAG: hypothetical protein K6E83_09465 [Clostridium sp.]|nr:hypothetical protein [Clostridium sp.]